MKAVTLPVLFMAVFHCLAYGIYKTNASRINEGFEARQTNYTSLYHWTGE